MNNTNMYNKVNIKLITTIKERCRTCYTCVRECPAKAIQISGGQAEVRYEKCIGCGNCVRVCRQGAKQYYNSIDNVKKLLEYHSKTAAIIAPSFAAEYYNTDYKLLVGKIRELGFYCVNEVAFGADLVARKVMEIFNTWDNKRYISSACPAVFEYIKRYHHNLIDYLSPVVSPMIATSRVLKHIHGDDLKIVFIGPCIAKKAEASDDEVPDEIDEVLTFKELNQLFDEVRINFEDIVPTEFDEPLAGKGSLFPLSSGLIQSVNVFEDLQKSDIVAAEGRTGFIDAIKEFESGDLNCKLLDLLCCNGCIMGAGMTTEEPLFRRRSRISKFVRNMMSSRDEKKWQENIEKYKNIDLYRLFYKKDIQFINPNEDEIRKILIGMGKLQSSDELNCGACGYETCYEHAVAVYNGLAENEMCLPYTIERLHKAVNQLEINNEQLTRIREALNQSEKLASMGQLAAGIAHELNNPLGIVLMYAHLALEEADKDSNASENLIIITEEANRCKKIVSDLLNFARKNKVMLASTDVCEMINQCVKITPIPKDVALVIEHNLNDRFAQIDRDQIVQVLNNLINNAITAMKEKGNLNIKTQGDSKNIKIIVSDTGSGIAEENLTKIFQPFFTTKEIGKGTGLGLAVTYGIIKMHRGNIEVKSNDNPNKGQTGTTFIVTIPRKNSDN